MLGCHRTKRITSLNGLVKMQKLGQMVLAMKQAKTVKRRKAGQTS